MVEETQAKRASGGEEGISRPYGLLLGLFALLLLLGSFSLVRGWVLSRDLDLHLRHAEALHALSAELEAGRPGAGSRPAEATVASRLEIWREAEAHARREEDTEALVAMRNLSLAAEALAGAEGADARWDAALAALAAAGDAEAATQRRLAYLHRRLGPTWAANAGVALAALAVAAGCLALARRLRLRHQALELAHEEALARASRDPLTGLWNHAAILSVLGGELERSRRSGVPLGVLLLDLDRFPETSRWVGTARGEEILEEVAARMARLVRPYDTLGRLSEHSFLTVLPACDEIATNAVAARLLEAVEGQEIEHSLGRTGVAATLAKVTVHEPAGQIAGDLASALDAAIERARGEGRSGVVTLEEEPLALP